MKMIYKLSRSYQMKIGTYRAWRNFNRFSKVKSYYHEWRLKTRDVV